ncbi:hypothetical protein [Mesorhizobium australicum]|uniref:hypothetical protein n=1 Tax=Mesorhizobium australicum TaxID=536018 RepID=UPI00333C1C9F
MKTAIVLSALALSLAAPAIASAQDVVIQTHRHHRHHWNDDNAVIINRDGQRLHHRHHGQVTFYDQGRRHHRSSDVVVTGSVDRPMHRHRHVIVQQDDNNDSDTDY